MSKLFVLYKLAIFVSFVILIKANHVEAVSPNHLIEIKPREYAHVIRTNVRTDERLTDLTIRNSTFLHPQVVLTSNHSFLYVEQTAKNRFSRMKIPKAPLPGVRLIEVSFHNGERHSREVLTIRGQAADVSELELQRDSLKVTYTENSIRGRKTLFLKFDTTENIFREASLSEFHNSQHTTSKKAWTASIEENNAILINSNDDDRSIRRSYKLRINNKQKIEIAAKIKVALGTRWSHEYDHILDLNLSFRDSEILKAHLTNNTIDEIQLSDGMMYVPFIVKSKNGKLNLDEHAVSGIVFDLRNMEINFMSALVDSLIDRVRSIQRNTKQAIGDATQLLNYTRVDSDITLAKIFISQLSDDLTDRTIHDGLVDTQRNISSLVFQFPFRFEGKDYSIAYAPGSELIHISLNSAVWSSRNIRPLQFQSANNMLCFSMQVQEMEPVQLTELQSNLLLLSIDNIFQLNNLEDITVVSGLPRGPQRFQLYENGGGAEKIQSLRIKSLGKTILGDLHASFCAAEIDSFELIDLHLKGHGLPILVDIGGWLRGDKVHNSTNEPVNIHTIIKTDVDFDVVTKSRKEIDVTVMGSPSMLRENGAQVRVQLAYSDERIGRYFVVLSNDNPQSSVTMATRYAGERLESGINYSLDGGEVWKLAEDGLYGFIYVE